LRLNVVGAGRNDFQLAAAADTFRELTSYTFSFNANKMISNDPAQNELGFILGGVYTQTVVISSSDMLPYTFDVNADDLGLDGETFSVEIEPLGTTTAVNQYRLFDLEITATDITDLTTNGTPYPWLDDYYAGLVTDEDYEAQDITDTDNDGFLAWQEYQLGTDPTNALSLLAITEAAPTAAGDEFIVKWQSADGKSYNILTNVNLAVGDWGATASGILSGGAETSYTATVGSAVNFFQVELD